ncbi:MAG: hypothetical protein ACU84Q_08230 [Gammaproteobacteria bacterium]
MKSIVTTSALLVGALAFSLPAFANDSGSRQMVTVIDVDFKGKPPFKRSVETLPMQDLAALEAAESAQKTTKVVTIDFKGKPPFKRNVENLVVRDIASLETVSSERRTNFRGKPPFSRR